MEKMLKNGFGVVVDGAGKNIFYLLLVILSDIFIYDFFLYDNVGSQEGLPMKNRKKGGEKNE
ncbi:hypothetical protein [Metallosphaera sp.]|uniref:hypothetical protein n=1 Tax=Metallosphaera sp. TaxID=2020860 RepID=UPI00316F5468